MLLILLPIYVLYLKTLNGLNSYYKNEKIQRLKKVQGSYKLKFTFDPIKFFWGIQIRLRAYSYTTKDEMPEQKFFLTLLIACLEGKKMSFGIWNNYYSRTFSCVTKFNYLGFESSWTSFLALMFVLRVLDTLWCGLRKDSCSLSTFGKSLTRIESIHWASKLSSSFLFVMENEGLK